MLTSILKCTEKKETTNQKYVKLRSIISYRQKHHRFHQHSMVYIDMFQKTHYNCHHLNRAEIHCKRLKQAK